MHSDIAAGGGFIHPRALLERPPLLYNHGANGSASDVTYLAVPESPPRHATRYGFAVAAPSLSFENSWGVPEGVAYARTFVKALRTFLKATDDPHPIYGGSMGAATSIQYACQYPDDVSCIALIIPALDLEYLRQEDVVEGLALRSFINESWDKTPLDSNVTPLPEGGNPINRASEISHIPIHMWLSMTGDDISHRWEDFVEDHGNCEVTDIGTFDHSAAQLAEIDPHDVLEFINSHTS